MNPYITGLPWAGGVAPAGSPSSYPGGSGYPWAGLTVQTGPAYTFFTPSPDFAPTARELNQMFAQRDQALLYVNGAIGPYQVLEDIQAAPAGQSIRTQSGTPATHALAQSWDATTFTAAHTLSLISAATATEVGDVLDLAFQGTLFFESAFTYSDAAFDFLADLFVNQNGAGFVDTGIQASWTLAGLNHAGSGDTSFCCPIVLRGLWTIGSGNAGSFACGINSCITLTNISEANIGLMGGSLTRLRHLRPY
jgi:hypothetical protein